MDRRESLNIDVKKLKKIFEKSQTIASDLVSEILNIKDWSTKQFIILSNGIPSEIGKLTKTTKHAKRHFWLNDVCTCHGLLPSHSA